MACTPEPGCCLFENVRLHLIHNNKLPICLCKTAAKYKRNPWSIYVLIYMWIRTILFSDHIPLANNFKTFKSMEAYKSAANVCGVKKQHLFFCPSIQGRRWARGAPQMINAVPPLSRCRRRGLCWWTNRGTTARGSVYGCSNDFRYRGALNHAFTAPHTLGPPSVSPFPHLRRLCLYQTCWRQKCERRTSYRSK